MSNFLRNNFILLDTKLNGLSESLQAPSTADDWYITLFVSLALRGTPSFVITKY